MEMSKLGPLGWTWLEANAINFPDNPTLEEQTRMINFLTNFCIPCTCQKKYDVEIKLNPITSSTVSSKKNLIIYIVILHNAVNARLNKKQYTLEEAVIILNHKFNVDLSFVIDAKIAKVEKLAQVEQKAKLNKTLVTETKESKSQFPNSTDDSKSQIPSPAKVVKTFGATVQPANIAKLKDASPNNVVFSTSSVNGRRVEENKDDFIPNTTPDPTRKETFASGLQRVKIGDKVIVPKTGKEFVPPQVASVPNPVQTNTTLYRLPTTGRYATMTSVVTQPPQSITQQLARSTTQNTTVSMALRQNTRGNVRKCNCSK